MYTNETAVEYIARVRNLAHQVKNSDKNDNEITLITKILGTLQTTTTTKKTTTTSGKHGCRWMKIDRICQL